MRVLAVIFYILGGLGDKTCFSKINPEKFVLQGEANMTGGGGTTTTFSYPQRVSVV